MRRDWGRHSARNIIEAEPQGPVAADALKPVDRLSRMSVPIPGTLTGRPVAPASQVAVARASAGACAGLRKSKRRLASS
jgi:hypothetical protein